MSGGRVDLHTHSTRSDGAYPPAEVVRRAAARGVRVQALTDHDTLSGVPEAAAEGERLGVRLIAGVELNTESEWGDVHVLGYFLDPADAELEERLRWLREQRRRRIELMVQNLDRLGIAVTIEHVERIAQGGSPGRPHLAQALLEAGHTRTFDQAFTSDFIGKDAKAYVARVGLGPAEAVALIRARGGAPSLAHPGTAERVDELVPLLVGSGLVGIECYYGEHTPEATSRYLALARRHGLVPTGGSDFHGRGEHGAALGGVSVPAESVAALEAARARWREYHAARVGER